MKYNIAQPESIAYIVLVSEPQPICGLQGCQLSRIWRDSHAFDLLLTHSRN